MRAAFNAPIRRGTLVSLTTGTVARVRRFERSGVCELAYPHGGFLCFSHLSVLTPAEVH